MIFHLVTKFLNLSNALFSSIYRSLVFERKTTQSIFLTFQFFSVTCPVGCANITSHVVIGDLPYREVKTVKSMSEFLKYLFYRRKLNLEWKEKRKIYIAIFFLLYKDGVY